jgi:hypothetical protein
MITTMPSDQNGPPPRVEVITSVHRRRRWPTADKIRLVEEKMQPGMSVSYVARRAAREMPGSSGHLRTPVLSLLLHLENLPLCQPTRADKRS